MMVALIALALGAFADEPATSYIFPAGGQRGTAVVCRVGGLNLSDECGFRMLGAGVEAPASIRRMPTLIRPGPYHQNPIAQQPFDYPQDMAASIRISADAAPGVRYCYCTTSEGATPLRLFVVGDLPEVLEDEANTRQGRPQKLVLPVTVNGRIYPRGDLDEYEFSAKAGDWLHCEVLSRRLGYKLDATLELFDPSGRALVASLDGSGRDPTLITALPADGRYRLRIHDLAYEGNQDYVYRLTIRIGPSITHVFPAGGRRGERSHLRLYGPGLSPEGFLDRDLVLDPAALSALRPSSGEAAFFISGPELSSMMPEFSGPGAVRGRPPVARCFQVGSLPEILEVEPNSGKGAQRVALPAVLNGQILPVGDVDEFVFAAEKGQKLDFELFGQRLGSPITAVVTLLDPKGKQVFRQEGDGQVGFAASADGDYTIRVQELHRETHGGSDYIYRLVASPPSPEFRLVLEKDNLGVLPGGSAKIKATVARGGGFAGEIELEYRDLPAGVQAAPARIAAGAKQVELVFSAAADAPIAETRRVSVIGGASVGGNRRTRAAEVPAPASLPGEPLADTLAVTVTHPPLFTIETEEVYGFANRGTSFAQRFTVTRLGRFEGEIELGIADRQARYLQGATGPTILVKSGEKEVMYPAFFPESMDLNRTARIVLRGTARVRDASGRLHTVSYTTKKQIVVRVCPSLLSLLADRETIETVSGREPLVTLALARSHELAGPVRIEAVLPEDARGITIKPVDVPEGQESVTMSVHLEPGAVLGERGPIRFRATGSRGGYPVLSETAIRLLPR